MTTMSYTNQCPWARCRCGWLGWWPSNSTWWCVASEWQSSHGECCCRFVHRWWTRLTNTCTTDAVPATTQQQLTQYTMCARDCRLPCRNTSTYDNIAAEVTSTPQHKILHSFAPITSGVTRVGVTWSGNWWCQPTFSLKTDDLILVIALWKVMTFSAVVSSPLTSSSYIVYPEFILNSAKK